MDALYDVSWISLGIAVACAVYVAIDVTRRPLKMWIMDIVWPVTTLYSGPLGLWAYHRFGRRKEKPFWQQVAVGATHCGSACTLADLTAEFLLVAFPVTVLGHKLFGSWVVDYGAAFLLGIVFQYFTIAPMRHLSTGEGIVAAVKADTLSLTAWQLGMYGWMAISTFLLFGYELPVTSPIFWFMMQIGMLCGFLTAYPVNWWLLRAGLKEAM
jgi:hypothetical protein